MRHKSPRQSVHKKQRDDAREPDDREEGERSSQVGVRVRGDEYDDVESSRAKSRRSGDLEIDDDDILESVDLDAAPEGDGPDA